MDEINTVARWMRRDIIVTATESDLDVGSQEQPAEDVERYAVITDVSGLPIRLLRLDTAPSSGAQDSIPQQPAETEQPTLVVEADANMENAATRLARYLDTDPSILGAIVVEAEQVVGVLPRKMLEERIDEVEIGTRGVTIPGNPTSRGRVLCCPRGDYRRHVTVVSPSNPPRCPKHQLPLR